MKPARVTVPLKRPQFGDGPLRAPVVPSTSGASDVSTGETLINGKYKLERRIGHGGMAEVFLARTLGAEGFEQQVAIKRILEAPSEDADFAQMFAIEAQLTSQLRHPNIVQVLDFDRQANGQLFLVMELVDGIDLEHLIESGPLPISLVVHLLLEILRGLDYAHERPFDDAGVPGVVHRDISPHNILLSWQGAVKVADFGIAKARAKSKATASQVIKGKPLYMAPEVIQSRPLDGRCDLWSVGVMAFQMLCHRNVFDVNLDNGAATMWQVVHGDIPDPREVRPDLPADLARVIRSLLTRDVEQRMPSAHAAIEELVQYSSVTGREELVAVLAERFPDRAPVRTRGVPRPARRAVTLGGGPTVVQHPDAVTAVDWAGAQTLVGRPGTATSDAATLTEHSRTPVPARHTAVSDLGLIPQSKSGPHWAVPVLASALVAAAIGIAVLLVSGRTQPATTPPPPSAPSAATATPPQPAAAIPAPAAQPPPPASATTAPITPAPASATASTSARAAGSGTAAPAPAPPTMPKPSRRQSGIIELDLTR